MVEIGAGSKAESGMEVRNAGGGWRMADSGMRNADSGMRIADTGMGIAENAKSGPVIIWDLSAPENTVDTTCSERSLIKGSRTGKPRPRWVQGCPAQAEHQII